MPKYEYMILDQAASLITTLSAHHEMLNRHGANGWQLKGPIWDEESNLYYIFEREVEDGQDG